MLSRCAVEIHTLPVNQCHFHINRYLEEFCDNLSHRRAAEKDRQTFGTHMENRETFLQSTNLHQSQELHQWNSSEEPLHSFTMEKSERPEQNQDLRCQSGPSAKDSVIWRRLFKELWGRPTTTANFGFILASSLHQQLLVVGR